MGTPIIDPGLLGLKKACYLCAMQPLSTCVFVSFSRPELKPVEKETEVVLRFPEVEKLSPPILMLSDVSFKYDKDARTIFSNVDLSATMESRICIVSLA